MRDPRRNQCGYKIGPLMGHFRIQDGSRKEPSRFQEGSKVGSKFDPSLIHYGSDKEPTWFQKGPRIGPFRIRIDPIRNQTGS